jgi:3-hydroxy-9,10-secoandrosta-1,3,5(10)-triene-9,17-dione monooxygenase reductase component
MTADPNQTEVAGTGPDRFRQVLGHFGTGITVITAIDDQGPAGFTCQSFAALSLEPPLVLFCPAKTSSTWPRIERAGRFCANVLGGSQRDIARQFASKTPDKFAGVSWSPVPSSPPSSGLTVPGLGEQTGPGQRPPLLAGTLAWVDAAVETVYDAGDHYLVTGRVLGLGAGSAGPPLLFYRGRFAVTEPEPGAPEIVDTMLAWPRHADWI